MTSAIIFDCFGVLATDTWPLLRDRYFHDPESRQSIEQLREQIDAGQLDRSVFIDAVMAYTGMSAEAVDAFVHANEPNEALLEYIAELKAKYKIGMLSNVSNDRTRQLFGGRRDLFDAITLSCDIGVTKPHVQAYEIAAQQLGVAPSECVFVDDRSENVAAARQAGMLGVEYGDFNELRKRLLEVLR